MSVKLRNAMESLEFSKDFYLHASQKFYILISISILSKRS